MNRGTRVKDLGEPRKTCALSHGRQCSGGCDVELICESFSLNEPLVVEKESGLIISGSTPVNRQKTSFYVSLKARPVRISTIQVAAALFRASPSQKSWQIATQLTGEE
ncbi:hypothetical protein M9H77_36262 [Catharanthus roseus]|uniref:Uncharacterized protein n=1 Tax=Catharanthus roseus TaxID=4058 RepID=A0ACB9ZRA7_CATRO|nr:hypothetical protein M9H77_36262 [Catharanthus roseus]